MSVVPHRCRPPCSQSFSIGRPRRSPPPWPAPRDTLRWPRAVRGVLHRPLLHRRDFARHPDDDARTHQHVPAVRLLDEVRQHLLRDFESAITRLSSADGHHVPRRQLGYDSVEIRLQNIASELMGRRLGTWWHQADERRGDSGFQSHGEDADALHPKGAHRHVLVRPRIVIGCRAKSRRRSGRCRTPRTAQGPAKCISWSRPWRRRSARACQSKNFGKHGGRHRWRHHGHRGDFHERDRLLASVHVAGNEMNEAVMQYLKRKYNLLVASAPRTDQNGDRFRLSLEKPLTMEVKGRNLIEGLPRTVTVDDSEIRESLSECVATIVNAVRVRSSALQPSFPRTSAIAESC